MYMFNIIIILWKRTETLECFRVKLVNRKKLAIDYISDIYVLIFKFNSFVSDNESSFSSFTNGVLVQNFFLQWGLVAYQ